MYKCSSYIQSVGTELSLFVHFHPRNTNEFYWLLSLLSSSANFKCSGVRPSSERFHFFKNPTIVILDFEIICLHLPSLLEPGKMLLPQREYIHPCLFSFLTCIAPQSLLGLLRILSHVEDAELSHYSFYFQWLTQYLANTHEKVLSRPFDRLHVQNALSSTVGSKLMYLPNSFNLPSHSANFRREADLSPVEDTRVLFLTSLEGALFLHCQTLTD